MGTADIALELSSKPSRYSQVPMTLIGRLADERGTPPHGIAP